MGSGNSRPFRSVKKTFTSAKEGNNQSNNSVTTKEFYDPFAFDHSDNQPLLSYAEAAALRPSNLDNMWAIVQKTCSNNASWALHSVKNRRGWKTIRLFVSSTFRDFHSEREVLVKEVRLR